MRFSDPSRTGTPVIESIKKAYLLLDPRTRRQWFCLVPLAFLEGIVESVGAAGVFTLIRVIEHPAMILDLPVLGAVYRYLGWESGRIIILSFTFLVAAYYIGKNVFLIASIYIRSSLTSSAVEKISVRLLKKYLNAPYTLYLERNHADLIDRISQSVDLAVRMTLESCVALISEVLILVGIAVVLVMVSPLMTLLSMGILAGILGVLLALTHKVFFKIGSRHQVLRQESLSTINQSLGGIKEIKVMGRESYWQERFADKQRGIAKIRRWYTTLNHMPRAMVETVFICIPLVMVLLSVDRLDQIGGGILPLLGLFAYAGFRAIPSFNRLSLNITNMRYSGAEVDLLYRDLRMLDERSIESEMDLPNADAFRFERELMLDGVSFRYEGKDQPVLEDIGFSVRTGESIGIAGVTGSGKSTLLDLILGLLEPSRGCITVDGRNIQDCLPGWHRLLGYVPQQIYLTDDTLRRNIAFGVPDEAIDGERMAECLGIAQLEAFVRELPQGLDTRLGERGIKISGGEKQRVAIARALYRDPEVLVFDEATSALDRFTEKVVTDALHTLHGRMTMIVVAHRLSALQHCDRVIFIQRGRIEAIGSLERLLRENDAFRGTVSTER